MLELITALQSQLQDDANLSYITDTNIIILVDPNLLPMDLTFPAIGLKDGDIDRIIEEAETWEPNYFVDIYIYQTLTSDEKCITGDGSGGDPYGVLTIADNIHTSLFDNKLSISELETALPGNEGGSEPMGFGDIMLIRKKIIYTYRKFETHP